MSKRAGGVTLESLNLDPGHDSPLHIQLYDGIRRFVLDGKLRAGLRLPASRLLASELCVSRTTVVQAYEKLLAEGYLEARVGAGTFVSGELPGELLRDQRTGRRAEKPRMEAAPQLSARAANFFLSPPRRGPHNPRPFEINLPAFDAFPLGLWTRIAARQWRRTSSAHLEYGEINGYGPLREALAEYLTTARGVNCESRQIFIVAGAHEAFMMTAMLVADPGDRGWVEQPGPLGVRNSLRAAGIDLVPIPLDKEGLSVQAGLVRAPDARVILTTPSHQHPLCMTMSLQRRLALIEAATKMKAWILEDDYDSEFRYVGRPLPALQGLDQSGRVIYVGTFSKVLFPALRLGYIVAPPQLVDSFEQVLAAFSRGAPTHLQAVVAAFIQQGHFTTHIRRMRKIYKQRLECLMSEAQQQLEGLLTIDPVESGMHVVGWLPPGVNESEAAEAAAARGLAVPKLSDFGMPPSSPPGLLLGFTCVPPEAMAPAIKKLREALEPLAR